ncbi:MAG: site-specific recombinase [Burkholderiaceae bacterium]
MRDLNSLLATLDPQAEPAQRHLWLIALLDWIRGDRASPQAAVSRVQLLLDAVQAQPEVQVRLQTWWQTLVTTVDFTALLADFGFATRTAFVSELAERLRRKLLPGTPETLDAEELFSLLLPTAFDARWLAALEEAQLNRLARLLSSEAAPATGHWQSMVIEAIVYCAGQVQATGFAPELRRRMSPELRHSRPFHALGADAQALRAELLHNPRREDQLQAAVQQLRERLDACRHAASTVYTHLEDNGISVGLVFRLRQLRERVLRIRELLDCLLSPTPALSAARLLSRLVLVGQERRSVRALIAANSSLLAAKVAERSAETGEHYITRDRAEYRSMLRKAAGGGALTALTTMLKFAVAALGLSMFWNGFWSSLVYAGSFVLIQLLHYTLATKQPAMTAPAMAAKLKDLGSSTAVAAFVDEVTHLVRSQVAAVLGNVLLVFPAVLLLSAAIQQISGQTMIDAAEAQHVLHSLALLGPTALFAAFTGVLLFASSIIAGWTENWFVLHRLDSALRYNPRITALLGAQRADRWARFMREQISGFASNISLGFMLGLIPAFAGFFGLGLEVRHVTLSAGQLAAASAALGWDVVRLPALWWCLTSIPVIGALNLGVSFYFAFRLALRAHNVSGVHRARIRAAIWARWRRAPWSFFIPARG